MKKSTKKVLSMMLVGMMTVAALTGCGSDKKAADTKIKIGGNLEMTGGSASFGKSASNAINLAVKQLNDKGGVLGKQLEFVVADNKSEPSEAMNALQKLIAQDKVVAVVGPNLSSAVIAGSAINDSSKIVTITPMGTNPRVTVDEKGNTKPYMFRACFIDPFQGTVMAKFAKNTLGANKVAIMIDNSSDYSKGLAKFFKQGFEAAGGEVVAEESFLQKDTDFRATLTKIKAQNPDMIYIPAYYQEVGLIVKQARALGMDVPMAGGDGWDSSKLSEIAGADALNNTYFSSLYSPNDTSDLNKDFVASYEKAYGQKPDVFAALAYDATNLLANAITNAKSTDGEKMKDAMAATKAFPGVSGAVTFDEQHNPIKGAVIIEYKDGKQVFNSKINP